MEDLARRFEQISRQLDGIAADIDTVAQQLVEAADSLGMDRLVLVMKTGVKNLKATGRRLDTFSNSPTSRGRLSVRRRLDRISSTLRRQKE